MKSLRMFFAIAFSTVLVLLFAGGLARQYGLSQQYQMHRHPLVQTPRPWVVASPQWVQSQKPADLAKLCQSNPQLWLALEINLQTNGTWTTTPSADSDHVENWIKPLAQTCKWFLTINSNVTDVHSKFLEWAKAVGLEGRFAVHSPYEMIVSKIKELDPDALYVASTREVTRLSIADQVGLSPAITMQSDILLVNPYYKKKWILPEPLITEIHRRAKHFCVGPLNDKERWNNLWAQNFDCILSDEPTLFLDRHL